MTYNLSQLVSTQTTEQKLAEMFSTLTGKGFAANTWQNGGLQKTLLESFAGGLATQSELLAAITKGGFLDDATGEWLTALASELYQETRAPAVSAVYAITLTDTAGSSQTINTGALWVGTADGRRYQNITTGTVPANGQLTILVQAESPGARHNTGAGTIVVMHTPITGVTCTNLSGNPQESGLDGESDASLRELCRDKWQSLGAGACAGFYRYHARKGAPSVAKVKIVTNPGGDAGKVGIYLAGHTSGVSAQVVSTVQAYVEARCPKCAIPVVSSASIEPLDIVATCTVDAASAPSYPAAATNALLEVFKAVPIGRQIDYSDLLVALASPAIESNIALAIPTGNVLPTSPTSMIVPGAISLAVLSE